MEKRVLGLTEIYLSEIGLGCASYWGKLKFNEGEAIKIVHSAVAQGINFFDTGHSYSEGNAEIRLGKAISNVSNKSDLVISSKAGTRIDGKGRLFKDFSPNWIRESCYLSIKRLGLEALPLLHLHGPSMSDFNDDIINELLKLKSEGYVKAIGVNTFDDRVLKKVIDMKVFDFVMPDYNILSRDREKYIEECYTKGLGVIAGAALADSLYSNRIFNIHNAKDLWYLGRALKNFRGKVIKGYSYRFINNVPGISGHQIALKYVLSNRKITSAVFGTTSEKHLLENIKSNEMNIPDEILQRILSI